MGLLANPTLSGTRVTAAHAVGCPGLRQLQGSVDEPLPTTAGVEQLDTDVDVLNAVRGTGALPLHSTEPPSTYYACPP